MRLPSLFARWGRRSTLLDPTSLRAEVSPPSLRHQPGSLWQRLVFWLMAPAPMEASPPLKRLPRVRREFMAALVDIRSDEAERLRMRIDQAHTLRELWHLRADTYRVVGLAHSQVEAEQRLAAINRHFGRRGSSSAIGLM